MNSGSTDTQPLILDEFLAQTVAKGVNQTLSAIFGVSIHWRDFKLTTQYEGVGDISGIMGLVQDYLEGNLTISFPKETILEMISRLYGKRIDKIDKSARDAVGEITNVVYGLVKKVLNERGYRFKMSIPNVITGDSHKVHHYHQGQTLLIPFHSDAGDFEVSITIQPQGASLFKVS